VWHEAVSLGVAWAAAPAVQDQQELRGILEIKR
jgi:hypothetical protein